MSYEKELLRASASGRVDQAARAAGGGDRKRRDATLEPLGVGDALADLAQHAGHRQLQGAADGRQQLTGRLLLPPLDLAEVAQRHPRRCRHLAQRPALLLALLAQHVADLLTEQHHDASLVRRGGRFAGPSPTRTLTRYPVAPTAHGPVERISSVGSTQRGP